MLQAVFPSETMNIYNMNPNLLDGQKKLHGGGSPTPRQGLTQRQTGQPRAVPTWFKSNLALTRANGDTVQFKSRPTRDFLNGSLDEGTITIEHSALQRCDRDSTGVQQGCPGMCKAGMACAGPCLLRAAKG